MKFRRFTLFPAASLTIGAALFLTHSAYGQTGSGWSGTTSSDMQTPANWDNGFGSNYNLFIGQAWHNAGRTGSTTINNASTYSGYRLNFENISGGANQTFTLQGSAISLFDFGVNSPAVINSSSVNQIINVPLVFNPGNTGVSLIQANGATGGNLTFGGTLSLGTNGTGNQLRISGANANTVTFSDVISATGGNSVVVSQGSSAITVVYNAANTYNGDTFIDSGTLQFGTAASSAGSANNSILRLGQNTANSPAATINLATTAGGVNVGSTIVVRPSLSGTTGTRTLSATNTSGINTFSGAVAMDTVATVTSTNLGGTLAFTGATFELKTFGLVVSGAGNTTISNVISSTSTGGALTKNGTGTLTLSGANNYSGLTNINGAGGTLITSGTNSSAGATTIQSGTLVFNNTTNGGIASGLLTISSGASVEAGIAGINLSNAVTLSTSSGGTTFKGSHSIVFNGAVNFTGTSNKGINNTMTNGSTVTLNGDLILNNTTANIYNNNAPNSGGAPGTVIVNGIVRTGLSATTAGSVSNTQGSLILTNNANSYAGATTVNGGILAGTVAHAFGDTTGINIAGGGTLSLRGDTSTSYTKLTGGALYSVTTSASGATINVDQATVAPGAKTMTIGTIGTSSTAAAYTLNFSGANSTSLSTGAVTGAASTAAGTVTIANAIAGGGSATLASYTSANTTGGETLTFSGVGNTNVTGAISPSSTILAVTKSGAGTLNLGGVNTYTGNTTINANGGTLQISGAGSLDSGSYAGAIAIGTNGALRYSSSAAQTLSGVISGAGTLTKDTSTTSTLSLTVANSYTGGTMITSGTLLANNASGSGLGTGAISVLTTSTLGGTGMIAQTGANGISVASGGHLAPGGTGPSSIESLEIAMGVTTGIVTMSSGSNFQMELGAANALITTITLNSSDQLFISGAAVNDVVFNGNDVDFLGTGQVGFYKLFDSTLAAATIAADTWGGLVYDTSTGVVTSGLNVTNLDGFLTGTFIMGGLSSGGDAGDIYLSVIPEPNSSVLLGGLGILLLLRRRRS